MTKAHASQAYWFVILGIFAIVSLVLLVGCGRGTAPDRRISLGEDEAAELETDEQQALDPEADAQAISEADMPVASPATAPAGPATGPGAAGGPPGGMRGGMGGGMRGGPQAATALAPPVGDTIEPTTADESALETEIPRPTTGISEVDRQAKIRDFAALYGSTALIKAQDWTGREYHWVSVTPDLGKMRGREVVLPLVMLLGVEYPEELEGYFPIYARGIRTLGNVISREVISVARREKHDMTAIRDRRLEERTAAIAAAQAAAAEAGTAAGAGAGMGGMGMAGGARGGMRGMGGGPRGGMGGGPRGGF